ELVVVIAAEAAYRAGAGQFYLVLQLPIKAVNIGARRHVFQIGGEELAAGRAHALQRFGLFGQRVRPFLGLRIVYDDLAVGGALVGADQKVVADVVNHAETVIADFGDDWFERLVARFRVAVEDRIALLAGPAVRDGEDCEPLVFGRPHPVEALRMRGVLIVRLVFGLRRPDLVKVDPMVLVLCRKLVSFLRLWIAAVIKTGALPSASPNLHPLQRLWHYLSRHHL